MKTDNINADKIKAFIFHSQSNKLGTELSDNVWKKAIKDFGYNQDTSSRGYEVNSKYDQKQINIFYKYSRIVNYPFRRYKEIIEKYVLNSKIIRFVQSQILKIVNYWIFRDSKASQKFGFDYPKFIYKSYYEYNNIEDEYKKFNEDNNLFFSHNSFKAYTYFSEYKKIIKTDPKNIIEVGSGLFNFGIILCKSLKEFNYVCVDLPNMLINGYLSCKKNMDNDIEVFLSHEIDLFIKSNNKKKIIFLLPSDLENLNFNFDLFVNHESFGEMKINTVNNYIHQVSKKMKTNSILFSVNRLSRSVSKWSIDGSHLTNFFEYNLVNFETLLIKIDNFRNLIPRQHTLPNIIYIGKKI